LHSEILTPGTIMTGFNSVRFDDEYLRFTFYRNFHNPYAWAWKDGRSRWDLLDVVRFTRALRPEGIMWPRDTNDDPTNTLVELAHANGLDHFKAHDALSDVEALMGLARVIRQAQPRLWQYLLNLRGKDAVATVIKPYAPEPFVYANGMYGREHDFTTVGVVIGEERTGTYYVYDLRHDPAPFVGLSPAELARRLFTKREELEAAGLARLPVKTLSTNKCPAVAPLSTLTPEAAARLHLDAAAIQAHWRVLQASGLPAAVAAAYRAQAPHAPIEDPDGAHYSGYVNDDAACAHVRAAPELTIGSINPGFSDPRLPELFLRYKGRNFPGALSDADRARWEACRSQRIMADIEPWSNELQDRYASATPAEQLLLTDLQLWAESVYPTEI
jgi:exodeoxyribonuclease-1